MAIELEFGSRTTLNSFTALIDNVAHGVRFNNFGGVVYLTQNFMYELTFVGHTTSILSFLDDFFLSQYGVYVTNSDAATNSQKQVFIIGSVLDFTFSMVVVVAGDNNNNTDDVYTQQITVTGKGDIAPPQNLDQSFTIDGLNIAEIEELYIDYPSKTNFQFVFDTLKLAPADISLDKFIRTQCPNNLPQDLNVSVVLLNSLDALTAQQIIFGTSDSSTFNRNLTLLLESPLDVSRFSGGIVFDGSLNVYTDITLQCAAGTTSTSLTTGSLDTLAYHQGLYCEPGITLQVSHVFKNACDLEIASGATFVLLLLSDRNVAPEFRAPPGIYENVGLVRVYGTMNYMSTPPAPAPEPEPEPGAPAPGQGIGIVVGTPGIEYTP